MAFKVEITPIAEGQIEKAYNWYRKVNEAFADQWFKGLMNKIATLQEMPQRCALAIENDIFSEDVRQLLYGKNKNIYQVLFTIREHTVYILYIRHSAQNPLTKNDLDNLI
ncbi:MAG: type II toxin-antitoxin system RelE/ParE family toxin [Crocosphaera sp.]|nr:type II toxin-antitoxin system RelE/ParE family toxin [Crocosphaera sp.]